MKTLSAGAEKFINKVVLIAVGLTPDPGCTGAVVAMLDTRDGPEAFPMTYEVGDMKKEEVHKHAYFVIEEALRLLDNGAHRSFDYAEESKHQRGGGVKLGEHKIVSMSGFEPLVNEGGSAVIAAYLQAEEEMEYRDEDDFLARCWALVDEFVEQAGASDNQHIRDLQNYCLCFNESGRT